MRNAFFCSGPYQVMLALTIKESFLKESSTDIYILEQFNFNKAKKIADTLNLIDHPFDRVKYVNCAELSDSFSQGSMVTRYFRFFNIYKNLESINQKYFEFQDRVYDEIYFSNPNNMVKIAAQYLYQKNSKLKINFFEDGLGGYADNLKKLTWRQELFQKITKTDKIFDYKNYYLFQPQLYNGSISQEKIKKIPLISDEEKKLKNILNQTFEYKKINDIKEKVVFFEQPLHGLEENINKKVIEILNNAFKKNFIVKLHPRSKFQMNNNNIKIHSESNIPWELEVLNNEVGNKILVSYFSTALITNKTIYNQEPYLIFLYNLEELKGQFLLSEDLLIFLKKFKKTYENNNRIFIPNNLQELREFTTKI